MVECLETQILDPWKVIFKNLIRIQTSDKKEKYYYDIIFTSFLSLKEYSLFEDGVRNIIYLNRVYIETYILEFETLF